MGCFKIGIPLQVFEDRDFFTGVFNDRDYFASGGVCSNCEGVCSNFAKIVAFSHLSCGYPRVRARMSTTGLQRDVWPISGRVFVT